MEMFTDKTRKTAGKVADGQTYALGQTVGYSLPIEDHLIGKWTSWPAVQNKAYLIIQIPDNMTRVNYCKLFWNLLPYEWYEGACIVEAAGTYQDDEVTCEVSIDEGVTWTAVTGSPFTGNQTNIDILTFFRKIQDIAGARVWVRWMNTATDDRGLRLYASGWIQGNLISV
jgi:hypothetical protein